MPRVRRRKKVRRLAFKDRARLFLVCGIDWQVLDGVSIDGDDELIREAWDSIRSDLMATWLVEHPGTRPWGWWRFEARGPRRMIAKGLRSPHEWPADSGFGIPQEFRHRPELFEREIEYLKRLDLLEPGELRAFEDVERTRAALYRPQPESRIA